MVNSDWKQPFQCVLMVAKISFWIVKETPCEQRPFDLPTKPSKKRNEGLHPCCRHQTCHQTCHQPCVWQGTDLWDFKKVSNFTMYRRWVIRTGPMVKGAEPCMEWKLRRGGLKAMEISSIPPEGIFPHGQGVLGRLQPQLNSAPSTKKRTQQQVISTWT